MWPKRNNPEQSIINYPAPTAPKEGRYGPYLSHNGVYANLPSNKTPETVTLDEAVALNVLRESAIRG